MQLLIAILGHVAAVLHHVFTIDFTAAGIPALTSIVGSARGATEAHLLTATTMAGDAAFATRVARLLTRPLVRGAFLVRGLAALARDLTLLGPIHRCKSAVFLCHVFLLPSPI